MKTICSWHNLARRELEAIKERGDEDDSGSWGYKRRGCYECNGFDETCGDYLEKIIYPAEAKDDRS